MKGREQSSAGEQSNIHWKHFSPWDPSNTRLNPLVFDYCGSRELTVSVDFQVAVKPPLP